MRTRIATAAALLIPLAGVSCTSHPIAQPPVAAALTDRQAGALAMEYLRQNNVPSGLFVAEERHSEAWWLYYQTAFDASARPPSVRYVIRVRDDGNVDQLR